MIFSSSLVTTPPDVVSQSMPAVLVKLKEAIDQCFKRLDVETIQQSAQLLESAQGNLLEIIQQRGRIGLSNVI